MNLFYILRFITKENLVNVRTPDTSHNEDMARFYITILLAFYSNTLVNCELTKTNAINNDDNPPDHHNHLAMARYIMHKADWVSLATVSTIPEIRGFPFNNIVSMSDGTVENSTGVPYFYLTPLDYPVHDIRENNNVSISATLEQTNFCRKNKYVPDDPRCARIMISGNIIRMKNDTEEYAFAKEALFTRHHSMAYLPTNHRFFVAKLNILYISLLNWFGGPAIIPIDDYLSFDYNAHFFNNTIV